MVDAKPKVDENAQVRELDANELDQASGGIVDQYLEGKLAGAQWVDLTIEGQLP